MNIPYYPGCSGHGSSKEYEASTRAVCNVLGISLEELNDWSCCGSTPAHARDHVLSAALSARNLAIAAARGAERVATPCPSCLANLKAAKVRMENEEFRGKVNALLDEPCPEQLPDAVSILQLLVEEIGIEAIGKKVKKPLTGLKVAAYYGCLLSRPADLMKFDDPENPMSMDNILTALGAEAVPFPLKTECCGAAMGIPRREVTARLSARLLKTARNYGADAIAVACPICHMNLDLRQEQAAKAAETEFNMPILYYTQLMGVAFGLSSSELGLDKLCVSPVKILKKINNAAGKEVSA